MWYVILLIVFLAALAYLKRQPKRTEPKEKSQEAANYEEAYKPKWFFSYNEKAAYTKLKEITDNFGYTLFAKVRLLDLIEPKTADKNSKGAMWKIQGKHVDFVICDQKLVAHFIIELDDESHEEASRKERDQFVDTVLQNCGYKVLHTMSINAEEIKTWLESNA